MEYVDSLKFLKNNSSFIASAAVGFFFFFVITLTLSYGEKSVKCLYYFVLSVSLFISFFCNPEKHRRHVCVRVASNASERIQCALCVSAVWLCCPLALNSPDGERRRNRS